MKNESDNLLYSAEKLINQDLKDKVTSEQKDKVSKLIQELKDAISANNVENIKTKMTDLRNALSEISVAAYQSATTTTASSNSPIDFRTRQARHGRCLGDRCGGRGRKNRLPTWSRGVSRSLVYEFNNSTSVLSRRRHTVKSRGMSKYSELRIRPQFRRPFGGLFLWRPALSLSFARFSAPPASELGGNHHDLRRRIPSSPQQDMQLRMEAPCRSDESHRSWSHSVRATSVYGILSDVGVRDPQRDPLNGSIGLRMAHAAGAFPALADCLLVVPPLRAAAAVPHHPRPRADDRPGARRAQRAQCGHPGQPDRQGAGQHLLLRRRPRRRWSAASATLPSILTAAC